MTRSLDCHNFGPVFGSRLIYFFYDLDCVYIHAWQALSTYVWTRCFIVV